MNVTRVKVSAQIDRLQFVFRRSRSVPKESTFEAGFPKRQQGSDIPAFLDTHRGLSVGMEN